MRLYKVLPEDSRRCQKKIVPDSLRLRYVLLVATAGRMVVEVVKYELSQIFVQRRQTTLKEFGISTARVVVETAEATIFAVTHEVVHEVQSRMQQHKRRHLLDPKKFIGFRCVVQVQRPNFGHF